MKELKLPASEETISKVIDEVEAVLDNNHCDDMNKAVILVAVEEVFVNIVNYAYGGENGMAVLQFGVDSDTRMFSMSFQDWGIPYNPLEKKDPDITLSAEERQIGGLGIFMVKQSMDQVTYEYKDKSNLLTIYKKV